MSHIIDWEPTSYEEESTHQFWKDAMMEEYYSIMKNDMWEIVSRPEEKSDLNYRWIYKIKHWEDGIIEK